MSENKLRIVKRIINNQNGEFDVEQIDFMDLHKGDLLK
ncbi:hypothetical protein [Microcystis phage MaeS]|nr:hypothetical protein [Microcystis phage MaeS]